DTDSPSRIAQVATLHASAPFWTTCPMISQLPHRTETTTAAVSDIPSERAHDGSNPHNTPETQAHPICAISSPNPKLDSTPPAAQHRATTLAIETTNRRTTICVSFPHPPIPLASRTTLAASGKSDCSP